MKLHGVHWMMARKEIIICQIIFTEIISLQMLEPSEERPEGNVHFAVCETNMFVRSSPYEFLSEGIILRHPDTNPTPLPERHESLPHPLLIRCGEPPLRVEFLAVGEIVLVLVQDPGTH
jgi:hypothetical protein